MVHLLSACGGIARIKDQGNGLGEPRLDGVAECAQGPQQLPSRPLLYTADNWNSPQTALMDDSVPSDPQSESLNERLVGLEGPIDGVAERVREVDAVLLYQ